MGRHSKADLHQFSHKFWVLDISYCLLSGVAHVLLTFFSGSKLSTTLFSRHFLLISPDKVCILFICVIYIFTIQSSSNVQLLPLCWRHSVKIFNILFRLDPHVGDHVAGVIGCLQPHCEQLLHVFNLIKHLLATTTTSTVCYNNN